MPTIQPRRAGILVPVFAIRTDDDLGIGDTGGVCEMIDWAAETGLGFLQFLPINATGGDSSPYNAISSIALDFLVPRISLKRRMWTSTPLVNTTDDRRRQVPSLTV